MKRILPFFTAFYFFLHSQAQTIAGAEIYYNKIGSKQYLITAQVYRICSGAPLNSLNGYVLADTFKIGLNLKRQSIQKINDTCGNPCNIQNSGSNPGYERHTFTDTVNFNNNPFQAILQAGLCTVKFAINQNIRDTFANSIQRDSQFYLDAELNICLTFSQINSPIFGFDPKFKTVCNLPTTYCPAPMDTLDYDSLSFSMDAPLLNIDQTVTYAGSLNQSIPMTPYCPPNPGVVNCKPLPTAKPPRGFYFDAEVCEMTLTPTKCDEVAPIKIRVTEWRRSNNTWVKIGYVTREMNVSVKQYTNDPSILVSNNKYAVCKNNNLCFNIQSYDYPYGSQSVGDTSQMLWNHGIPSATCTVTNPTDREKQMQFCWKPQKAGRYLFAVMAYDKKCNIHANSKGFSVQVKPLAETKRSYTYSNCSTLTMVSLPVDTVNQLLSNYTYAFTVFPTDTMSKTLFNSTAKKAQFKIPYTGYFTVKHSINNGGINCPLVYWDTLYLVKNEIKTPKKQLACLNDTVYLEAYFQTKSPIKYQWEYPLGTKKPTDTAHTFIVSANQKAQKIALYITDKNTCSYRDTFEISARGAFDFNRKSGNVCNSLNYTLAALNIKGASPFIYDWYINSKRVNTIDSFITQNFKQNSSVVLRLADSTYCSFSDTLLLSPIAPPSFNMVDDSACMNSIIKIIPQVAAYPEKLIYDWTLDGGLSSKHDTSFTFNVSKTHTLQLTLRNAIACNAQKNIQVYANPLPTFNIIGNSDFNRFALVQLSTDIPFSTYQWSNGATRQQNDFWASSLGGPGNYTLWCKVTDSNACSNIQFKQIRTDQFTKIIDSETASGKLYPNPATAFIVIENSVADSYQIQNYLGSTVQTGNLEQGVQSLDIRNLAPGIYIFQCGANRIKFVKE